MIELLSNALIYQLIGMEGGMDPPPLLILLVSVSGLSPEVPLVSGCEQVKFYYQHGAFDSSYVLKDVDSTVLSDGCVDGCVYMK